MFYLSLIYSIYVPLLFWVLVLDYLSNSLKLIFIVLFFFIFNYFIIVRVFTRTFYFYLNLSHFLACICICIFIMYLWIIFKADFFVLVDFLSMVLNFKWGAFFVWGFKLWSGGFKSLGGLLLVLLLFLQVNIQLNTLSLN